MMINISLKVYEKADYIITYFINLNNHNEYLISKSDWDKRILIVSNTTDNYKFYLNMKFIDIVCQRKLFINFSSC